MRVLAWLPLCWLIGCAQILGLEDRELEPIDSGMTAMLDAALPDGGQSDAGGNTCEHYCGLALDRCKAEQQLQLFDDAERCMAVCQEYPPGDPANPTGNTLACRIAQLEKIKPGETVETRTYCPPAGPGGGAAEGEGEEAACGSNCEGFCRLRQAVCPLEQAEVECQRKCAALPDTKSFDSVVNFKGGADNLQCRLAHLSAAVEFHHDGNMDARNNHCAHSNIKSSVQCDLNQMQEPDCAELCKIIMAGCPGENDKVYDDQAQCEAVCKVLAAGTSKELTANNRRCRREWAYDALVRGASSVSCESAGPAPPLCGAGKCANYCDLARAACTTQFDMKYKGTPDQNLAVCRAECETFPDSKTSSFYTVGNARGDTFNCRLRNTAMAFSDPRMCDSAVGDPVLGTCKN